jgi:hypothetical protein
MFSRELDTGHPPWTARNTCAREWALPSRTTVTILDIIHRPAFYLKHSMHTVRTSQGTRYFSATRPTSNLT